MAFNPQDHCINLKGKQYLPVSARLVWFRSEHPDWGIVTTPVEINMEKHYAIFSASIFNADGKLMATATKMENAQGFPDFLEKAETGAVGRALAYCGFGTQFAPELEEGARLADSPYRSGSGGNRFAAGGPVRPGNGNGNGMNRPMPPRPTPPPPMGRDDANDRAYRDEEAAPAPRGAGAPLAPSRPAENPPREAGGPAFTRVREPERPAIDPGGPGEDDEDPFAEEESGPTMTSTARPAAEAPQRPAEAKPNPLAGNRCSVDGCTNVLTASQMTMSTNKFGRPLCLLHQRDAQPVAAGAGAGARRGSAKPEPADTLL